MVRASVLLRNLKHSDSQKQGPSGAAGGWGQDSGGCLTGVAWQLCTMSPGELAGDTVLRTYSLRSGCV